MHHTIIALPFLWSGPVRTYTLNDYFYLSVVLSDHGAEAVVIFKETDVWIDTVDGKKNPPPRVFGHYS